MTNKFTEFWSTHLSAPLGRHMTQTYWDACPGDTLLYLGWEANEPIGGLRKLAEDYVEFNLQRPKEMYKEINGEGGVKISGYDHGHFVMSYYADIIDIFSDEKQLRDLTAGLMLKHLSEYFGQKNSYLANPKGQKYGMTGRCRIAAMIIRAMTDAYKAAMAMSNSDVAYAALDYAVRHADNVVSQINSGKMYDEAQGDGLTIPHYRVFQVGMLAHALLRLNKVINEGAIETAVGSLTEIVQRSTEYGVSGSPVGFWYDVPISQDVPRPWPGAKLGSGNGVEPWAYSFMGSAERAVMDKVNVGLHPAIKSKFFME